MGRERAWWFETDCIAVERLDDLQDPDSSAAIPMRARRITPRTIAGLLVDVCQLCVAGRGNAQESIPATSDPFGESSIRVKLAASLKRY
jgi:hypothetical protein